MLEIHGLRFNAVFTLMCKYMEENTSVYVGVHDINKMCDLQ